MKLYTYIHTYIHSYMYVWYTIVTATCRLIFSICYSIYIHIHIWIYEYEYMNEYNKHKKYSTIIIIIIIITHTNVNIIYFVVLLKFPNSIHPRKCQVYLLYICSFDSYVITYELYINIYIYIFIYFIYFVSVSSSFHPLSAKY